jgi:hypothetical protein
MAQNFPLTRDLKELKSKFSSVDWQDFLLLCAFIYNFKINSFSAHNFKAII